MEEQYKLEIEYLKRALGASQKKVDRYAHISTISPFFFQIISELVAVASLSDELDSLRSNICQSCKRNFVPSTESHSAISPNPTSHPSPPPTATDIPLPVVPASSPPMTDPAPVIPTPSNPPPRAIDPEPTWSVEHNPKLKQSLDLQIEHSSWTSMMGCVQVG